jgi:dihydrofolate reductase
MRKLIAINQVTLDGVIQGPGGPGEDTSNGFTLGGWSAPFRDEAGGKALAKIMAGEYDLLLGRKTYDIWAGYWPKQSNAIATAFNQATKYVVTRGLGPLDWKTSVRIGDDVVDGVRRLKDSEGPDLHTWGSHQLLQALIAADLIDEYRMMVFPVVLGQGKHLFENGVPPGVLALIETQRTPEGVFIHTYRSLGSVKPGSFTPETPANAELLRRVQQAAEASGN